MPKHGITALIDFIEPFEAKRAFTKLAYSQFKSTPLYLEWAPENIFVKSKEEGNRQIEEITPHDPTPGDKLEVEMKKEDDNVESKENVVSVNTEEHEEPENDSTVFVKNLNFKSTEDSIKQVCRLKRFLFSNYHIHVLML